MSISFLQELPIFTLVVLLVPLYLYLYLRRSNGRSKGPAVCPTNWPILYMFPSLLTNLFNVHDYLTIVLAASGHNCRAHGPPGTGMRFFITCDPANVRHIFTTNYANFPKGEDFAAIFDIMVGSLFTVDGEPCRQQRAKMQSVLRNPQLVARVAASCRDKVEKGLVPLFTHMASTDTTFDLQEVITRFMFDLTATMIFSVDPGLLSTDMPPMDVAAAMDTVMEVGFFRHTVPAFCWKVMRLLSIGPERKLEVAQRVLRGFVTEMIMQKRKMKQLQEGCEEDILSSYIDDPNFDDNLLRSTLFSSMLAGRDTLGMTLLWFLYNLAQNPKVVSTIRNELSLVASHKASSDDAIVIFEPEETKSLVYLRAALYETLRLYPPGPFERKTVAADDTMPSGHEVRAGDTIIVSLHSMGRMEGVWGKDCLEYNPDRWLSDGGNKLRYVPSHKFLAFNSGPRMCIGKDIAVMEMATIVAAVVWNFDVEVLEGQTIQPKLSCVLQMKDGLKVNLKQREM
ncbi:unnamed protein product [Alopecurus aequalis]